MSDALFLAIRDVFIFIVFFTAGAVAAVFVGRDPFTGPTQQGAVLVGERDTFAVANPGSTAVSTTLTGATNGETGADGGFGFDPIRESILAILDDADFETY